MPIKYKISNLKGQTKLVFDTTNQKSIEITPKETEINVLHKEHQLTQDEFFEIKRKQGISDTEIYMLWNIVQKNRKK